MGKRESQIWQCTLCGSVIPAKAGIHGMSQSKTYLDTGFRRRDEKGCTWRDPSGDYVFEDRE
jgi:ribosomal protein L37AE/L43A